MLDLEEQIQRLADHSFAQTEPVLVDRRRPASQRRQQRYWAVAAAVIALAGIAGALAIQRGEDAIIVATGGESVTISDPLRVDLDELIRKSEGRRVNELGPLLTFDFDRLPAEWNVEQLFAITVGGDFSSPEYWQQLAIRGPGGERLVMNVTGFLDGREPTADGPVDGEPVEVRGQPGQSSASGIAWTEQDRAWIRILNGPVLGARVDHQLMMSFAQLLEPTEAELDWSAEDMALAGTTGSPDVDPLLSGTLAGVPWRVVLDGPNLQLATGEPAQTRGGPPRTEPFDPRLVEYSIEPIAVPGGLVVFGHGPDSVSSVRLRLERGTAELPVVPYGDGRVAFVVPISDQLDPTAIEFLDHDGQVVATIDLTDLPPYMGGSIGGGVQVAE